MVLWDTKTRFDAFSRRYARISLIRAAILYMHTHGSVPMRHISLLSRSQCSCQSCCFVEILEGYFASLIIVEESGTYRLTKIFKVYIYSWSIYQYISDLLSRWFSAWLFMLSPTWGTKWCEALRAGRLISLLLYSRHILIVLSLWQLLFVLTSYMNHQGVIVSPPLAAMMTNPWIRSFWELKLILT